MILNTKESNHMKEIVALSFIGAYTTTGLLCGYNFCNGNYSDAIGLGAVTIGMILASIHIAIILGGKNGS